MKSRIKCKKCGYSFEICEEDLASACSGIHCPNCAQPFDETIFDNLKLAFESIHEYLQSDK